LCTPRGQLVLPEVVRAFGYRWSKSLMYRPLALTELHER
jgi:hypothetical protein